MTTWLRKVKQLLLGFLATHDDKYLVTETGLKLVAFDYTFKKATKSVTSYTNKTRS